MAAFEQNLVDLHAHILPGVDHGSQSVEMSLDMIRKAKSIGIRTIVASSHYYHHTTPIDEFLDAREQSYQMLTEAMKREGLDDVRIVKAAEVALESDLVTKSDPEKFHRLCIDGTDFLLLELPLYDVMWSDRIYDSIYEIEYRYGVKTIIAHIERYNRNYAERLIEQPRLAQMNADLYATLSGKHYYKSLLNRNAIHFLGSDAHRSTGRNYDNFEKVVKKMDRNVLAYFTENAHRVLKNEMPDVF
ncbi:MAG: CpsB/CapC family capsule biosynthesis tyrosine phosphatase [Eubacteriales bacterium]